MAGGLHAGNETVMLRYGLNHKHFPSRISLKSSLSHRHVLRDYDYICLQA